jgi:UDP-2,4-diacetamido-2,4,6-trideoxy-beta-L-altropyranose hydrolase
VDGYHFGAEYQKQIKDAGFSLLFIDDYGHADYYYADIVLNQNIYADMSFYYNFEPHTRFLFGTKYVLLRKEFLKYSDWHHDIPDVARRILVTLGGSDPENLTLKVIEAVKTVDVSGLEVIVVVGGMNPHFDLIHETVKDFPNFTLLKYADNMPELMAWADIAISAGGSTCWELAYMGTPFITLIIADNQIKVADTLHTAKAAISIGDKSFIEKRLKPALALLINSKELRQRLSINAKSLIDGEGCDRVINQMDGRKISLRRVNPVDCNQLLVWANDPDVRCNAFNQDIIDQNTHLAWFSKMHNSPHCYHYIAVNSEDLPIGQIRFNVSESSADVDVSLDKDWRNKGLGSEIIRLGVTRLFRESEVNTLHAYIKTDNKSSLNSFVRAGFSYEGKVGHKGSVVFHCVFNKSPLMGDPIPK